MSARPPAIGRWLLRLGLPDHVVAEAIAGDLEQEYHTRPRALWYVSQVVGIVLRATRDRLRGRTWFARGARADVPTPRGPRRGEGIVSDLRFAARVLRQRPLFAAVAVGTLAVGMAINTSIFSVVNALLLRPIPAIDDPATLVEIARGRDSSYEDVAWGAFRMLHDDADTLEDVAGWDGIELSFRDAGQGDAVVLSGREVTGNYFSVLGVEPGLGRYFAPDRLWPDVAAEVVISHYLWQERYDGREDVLGQTVFINGTPATIIGVTPQGFAGHQLLVQRDIFVPIGMPAPGMLSEADLSSPRNGYMVLLGRMAEGVGIDAVREEITRLGNRFWAENGIDQPYHLRADPYGGLQASDRSMVATFFGLLLVTSATLMVIACVNVANMLLSRGLERRRELAIRMSLGAGRWRVARQLLTESGLLFVAAGVAGLLITGWVTDVLVRLYLPSMTVARLHLDVSPDLRVLGFALLVAAVTALIFGLAPALSATRAAGALIRGSAAHQRAPRLRSLLVGGQMALSLVLLVAAGLMTRTLAALDSADLGFDVDGIYLVKLDVEHAGYDRDRTRDFYVELLEQVRAIPGVTAAATSRKLPLGSASRLRGIYPRAIEPPTESGFTASFNRVSTDYFRTAGIPLLEGRAFRVADTAEGPRVAIVNAAMASRVWGDEGAVGKYFDVGSGDDAIRYEVVGVAADANYHAFVEETPDFLYLAATQSPDTVGHLLVRADMDRTLDAVRARVAQLDPDVPIAEVSTVREAVEGFAMGQRLAAWVAGVVGFVGLLLGAVGVYGVTAYAVSHRSHEIGVRIALGARAADVRHLLLRSGMRAPLAGMVVGLGLAAAVARLIGSFLYGVSAADPLTWVGVVALLGAVAVLATLLPANRAAALDPVCTLRSE